jgi:small multidrug resistance family-3 protein
MWLWWRDGRPWPVGMLGAAILLFDGIIPTYQAADFGRVYAAYGGVFVVLSVPGEWAIGGIRPDGYDVLGGVVCLLESRSLCMRRAATDRRTQWNLP